MFLYNPGKISRISLASASIEAITLIPLDRISNRHVDTNLGIAGMSQRLHDEIRN